MKLSPARMFRTLTRPISKRSPIRRDDSGLTTLEWLLIVAAVAGLAALAVVLVTNVVSDTSDQIEGQSARLTAAKVAGARITRAAQEDVPDTNTTEAFAAKAAEYEDDCDDLELVYADVDGLDVDWVFTNAGSDPLATDAFWEMAFANTATQGCTVTVTP